MRKVHKKAAGADLGSREFYIALENGEVKSFETFTSGLRQAVAYLVSNRVKSLAMEATGVYWINLYQFAEEAGIEVYLVNPYDSRNLPGRKTDVLDCQWIQQLHSHGLLRKCFVPPHFIQQLRDYMRLREDHIEMGSTHIQHMQKALIEMNIQLTGVLSQVHGKSGMAMINAIIDGERDPEKLLAMCDRQIIKNKSEQVLKALEGNYAPHYLFALRQARDLYLYYHEKIKECDQQVDQLLKSIHGPEALDHHKGKAKPIRHHAPAISKLHAHVLLLTQGNDVTQIPGLTDYSVLRILAETGTDMSNWRTIKHFTSWLGLAPKQNQSGKMRKTSKHRPNNRAGQIFRTCAQSLLNSKKNALGAFGRRIRARKGPFVAIKALARKLAEMFYRVLTKGWEYVEQGVEEYNRQYQQKRLQYLLKTQKTVETQIALLQEVT